MTKDLEIPGAMVPIRTPRLVPHIVDSKAEAIPHAPCLYAPTSTSDPQHGWEPITWAKFANAINHAANWLHGTLGIPEPDTFPTVAYLGPNDARYYALVIGAQKAGYKALLVSPRNSQQAQLSLIERTQCDTFIVSPSFKSQVEQWIEHRPTLNVVEVPSYHNWFTDTRIAKRVPYTKTYEQARLDPMVVLHTSGSTGIPKPVVSPHGMICISDQLHDVPKFQKTPFVMHELKDSGMERVLLAMPLFHAAGLNIFLLFSIYWDIPVALGIPDKPLSLQAVSDYLRYSGVDAAIIPPAILAQMSEDEIYIEQLRQLKSASYGGGPLPPEAGARLIEKGVNVMNWIATTECAPYLQYHQPNKALWQYYIFNPTTSGMDFRRVNSPEEPRGSENDIYRMIIKRHDQDPGYQGWFYTFPNNEEYDTQDLFRPHPTLPNHWQYAGRGDDIIVFSNGEKLNPTSIEGMLYDSPHIKGAVVTGQGQFQAGLILEPEIEEVDEKELIDKIWPVVERANAETVTHGRIARHLIMVTKNDKPFPRAGKGTVQRAGAAKLYQEEIEAMYAAAEKGDAILSAVAIDASSEDALVKSISDIFQNAVSTAHEAGKPSTIFQPDTDLFSAGVDSLMVINTSRQLRLGMEAAKLHDITPKKDGINAHAIYANPTPRQLAQHILRSFSARHSGSSDGVKSSSASDTADDSSEVEHTLAEMQALLEKFTTNLPQPVNVNKSPAASSNQTVLVTGTTGLLGSHILEILHRNPLVGRVICLNRAADGGLSKFTPTKQRRDSKHSDYNNDDERIEFLHANTAAPNFGLPIEVYSRLLNQTDKIIHNAWPVNFNIPLSSFSSSLQGVRNIADFATACVKKPVVVFVSSIASVHGYTGSGAVPEERYTDFRIAVPGGGYGQSKMVGSLVLDAAASHGGFDAATVRLRQIAGCERDNSLSTVWNRQEWLPSLVASSIYLEALPRTLGRMDKIDWVPVERMAGLCCEIAGVDGKTEAFTGYFHGVNPQIARWEELCRAVQDFYKIPKLVEIGVWVEMMEKSRTDIENTGDRENVRRKVERNPGVKILDTYRAMAMGGGQASLGVTRSFERSEILRTAEPITPSLMKKWCTEWAF